jgi:hypothetical protein
VSFGCLEVTGNKRALHLVVAPEDLTCHRDPRTVGCDEKEHAACGFSPARDGEEQNVSPPFWFLR